MGRTLTDVVSSLCNIDRDFELGGLHLRSADRPRLLNAYHRIATRPCDADKPHDVSSSPVGHWLRRPGRGGSRVQ